MKMIVGGQDVTNGSVPSASSYDAAIGTYLIRHGRAQQDILSWYPGLRTADDDHSVDFATNKARARELSWQEPYGANAVRIARENIVGKSYALSLDIDARSLGLTEEAAHDWEMRAEDEWARYAEGSWFGADAARKNTWTFLMHQVAAGLHMDGEVLAMVAAKPGWEGYMTCLHLIEPERLVNPPQSANLAGFDIVQGVERDRMGEPIAYHIRKSYPNARAQYQWQPNNALDWERIERMTEWGRPLVLHLFDDYRPNMSRGVSQLISVMKQMKMLGIYSDTEVERAIMSASFAAVIESELNYDQAMKVIGAEGGGGFGNGLTGATMDHLKNVAPYYQEMGLRYNGSRIAHLVPGEKLKVVQSAVNAAEYDGFEKSMVRQIAAGLGVAYESLSRDFSNVSYSAARQSLADIWRSFLVRREMLNKRLCMPFVGAWLEEAILSGFLKMPDGSEPTLENWIAKRHFIVRGTFISWGKPVIDPVKERQGQQMALAMGLTTLEEEAGTEGKEWDAIARQRKQEMDERDRLGLNVHGVDPTAAMQGITPQPPADSGGKTPGKSGGSSGVRSAGNQPGGGQAE